MPLGGRACRRVGGGGWADGRKSGRRAACRRQLPGATRRAGVWLWLWLWESARARAGPPSRAGQKASAAAAESEGTHNITSTGRYWRNNCMCGRRRRRGHACRPNTRQTDGRRQTTDDRRSLPPWFSAQFGGRAWAGQGGVCDASSQPAGTADIHDASEAASALNVAVWPSAGPSPLAQRLMRRSPGSTRAGPSDPGEGDALVLPCLGGAVLV